MNNSTAHMTALFGHWFGKLSPTLFLLLAYFYWKAALSPDGKVSQSIAEIAAATNFTWRYVHMKLHDLEEVGAIEILSTGKERTVVKIAPRYWLPPAQKFIGEERTATIPELIHGLCGQRASPEMLALMQAAADNDELRLTYCLDAFFRQGKRWATVELLTVAVQDEFRYRSFFDERWPRP